VELVSEKIYKLYVSDAIEKSITNNAPPLYPLDRPAVEWVTFADETGCGLWLDDPATIGEDET
jgi:hypothetical protein